MSGDAVLSGGEAAAVLAIMAALALGAMSPGPSFVLVARTAASHGRASGLRVAVGLGLGGAVFGLVAVLGLVSLLTEVAWLARGVRVAGGAYLLWLAWRLWRPATRGSDHAEPIDGVRTASLRTGLLTQLANPKTAVVYAAVLAALLPAHVSVACAAAVVAGALVVELGWYAVVAALFSTRAARAAYSRAGRWIDRAAGTVLALLGLRLIADRP